MSGQEEITEFLDHAIFREKVLKGCISRLLSDYLLWDTRELGN